MIIDNFGMSMKQVIIAFVSHVHMSIVAVNKVVFLKVMAGLNRSVLEVSNNIEHEDRPDLDHNDRSNLASRP